MEGINSDRLRCAYLKNPVGIDLKKPLLSWNVKGNGKQTAYEVETWKNAEKDWCSGKVFSASMRCRYEGNVSSRDCITWKVRLYDEKDQAGEWSEEQSFEYGLLQPEDWSAKWICGVGTDVQERLPADYYRREFSVSKKAAKARLYATACGIYQVRLNGALLKEYCLAPGFTQYDKRLYYQTYDVTEFLGQNNELVFIVGDGWFKGKLGYDGDEYIYGTQTKLLAQLEITYEDGSREIIGTGSDFQWCNDGSVRENDMKDGVVIDATHQPSFGAQAVETEYAVVPTASNANPIREQEEFAPKLLNTPSGQQVLDFGQNMAGYVYFRARGQKGEKVTVQLGETLDNGEFSMDNITTIPERGKSILQTETLILSGGEDEYCPAFFYSGFRYALVQGVEKVNPGDFRAVAVYSDIEYAGSFECSNPRVNQFVQNTIWSEKSNFIDIPTDCPQREKAGWTGDAQVFCKTAAYLADTGAFFRKWLKDVRDSQREDGRVENVAPKIAVERQSDVLNGSVGWADAAVIIPYTMWKFYGDEDYIYENYELMKGWKSYVTMLLQDKSMYQMDESHPLYAMYKNFLLPDSPHRKYVLEAGVHWGEWAEPEGVLEWDQVTELTRPKQEEATAFLYYSMTLLTEMLQVMGKKEEAAECEEIARGAKEAYRYYFVEEHDIVSKRQAKLVRPLAFGLLDEQTRRNVAKRLKQVAEEREYTIGTGFLSTPYILPVLAENGYLEDAYRVLENTKEPGWLAMVEQGATTVWENYNGYSKEGHPLKTSYNHYSPGAVCSFLFSHVAGIQLMGENAFLVKPMPGGTLKYAKAKWLSAYGEVICSWERQEGGCRYKVRIPGSCSGILRLPDGTEKVLQPGWNTFLSIG